jgi:hypothetical protein
MNFTHNSTGVPDVEVAGGSRHGLPWPTAGADTRVLAASVTVSARLKPIVGSSGDAEAAFAADAD